MSPVGPAIEPEPVPKGMPWTDHGAAWRASHIERRQIDTTLRNRDGFRRSPGRFGSSVPYKEWQHFLVHVPPDQNHDGLKLIVNFNLLDEVWGPQPQAETARLILLARSSEWTGCVRRFRDREVHVRTGSIDCAFGPNLLRYRAGRYHLSVDLPERGTQIDLTLTPETIPGLAVNQPLAPGLRLSWIFVPRLRAHGFARIEGQQFQIDGALAYHDHNWSNFRWGDDFTWEWASILPDEPTCPWSFVLMRLTDRARTMVRSQAVFAWHRAQRICTLRDREFDVETSGAFSAREPVIVPSVMRLLTTGRSIDVPSSWRLTANPASGHNHSLEIDFVPLEVSQVVMPGETSLERVAVLNEATGPVTAAGSVNGESVNFRGQGVFEFLRT